MDDRRHIIIIALAIAAWAVTAGLLSIFVHWSIGLGMGMAAIVAVALVGIVDGRRGS